MHTAILASLPWAIAVYCQFHANLPHLVHVGQGYSDECVHLFRQPGDELPWGSVTTDGELVLVD